MAVYGLAGMTNGKTKGKRLEDIQVYFQAKSDATSSAPPPPH
jgi:hypothetical protein